MAKHTRIGILGAGAWGTALAVHLANQGHAVRLWTRHTQKHSTLSDRSAARKHLSSHSLPDTVVIRDNLAQTVIGSDWLILAVPAAAVHAVLAVALPYITSSYQGVICTAKGMDRKHGLFMHQVIPAALDKRAVDIYLSGPSFADEVIAGLPTAVILATYDTDVAKRAAALFHSKIFRVYISTDVIGVEVAGALKNVIAIAAGVSDGLGYGANARAALITRGLSEIRRFALRLGASSATFSGLAGLGDLVLTCTDQQSRNYRYGKLLARGSSNQQARQAIGQVVEGVFTAQIVCDFARRENVELPICFAINQILRNQIDIKQVVDQLLDRDVKIED